MKVLYICTHNRCRSILSEAMTNHLAKGFIEARSAGSHPCGHVHPLSIQSLAQSGIPTTGLRSQSWDEFEDFLPDIVITVCDTAAGEACPVWFGKTLKVHWGLTDPSQIEGSQAEKEAAFQQTLQIISKRIQILIDIAKQPRHQWPQALALHGAQ